VKNLISKQLLYILLLSFVLLIFVLIFSFALLIPQGKEYRIQRLDMKQHYADLYKYRTWSDETSMELKELKSKNQRVINAFDKLFTPERFITQNQNYFETLKLSEIKDMNSSSEFTMYEVTATSKINSPTQFYNFLETINKSDWMIGVTFPIVFQRDKTSIHSSFKMRVYSSDKLRAQK
jgi:hypothetical protein